MKQTVTLVNYTKKEELYNSLTHALGAVASAGFLVLCVHDAVQLGKPLRTASAVLCGLAMIVMYSASAIYHGVKPGKLKSFCRIIDHSMVFLAVAGCATPCAALLREYEPVLAVVMFVIAWGAFTAGVLMANFCFEKTKGIRLGLAIGAGIVMAFTGLRPMLDVFPAGTLVSVFGGGAFYIIGAVLYGVGKKKRYFHSVFHVFVLLGSAFHLYGIWYYIFSANAL